MFEQHEREEIARMELSNLRRQVANQSCVIAELKGKLADFDNVCEAATQAQRVLASLTDEKAIQSTTVISAYAQVREAEMALRSSLAAYKKGRE